MATSKISGKYFSYDGGIIDFFGARGYREGKNWCVNRFFGVFAEVAPDDEVLQKIQECISDDYEAGNGEKVAELWVSPQFAVDMFLAGIITTGDLRKIAEDDDLVRIPGITIRPFGHMTEAKLLTVVIDDTSEYSYATADATGQIIP